MADHYADDGGRYIAALRKRLLNYLTRAARARPSRAIPGRSACLKSVARLGVGVEGLGASVAVLGSLAFPKSIPVSVTSRVPSALFLLPFRNSPLKLVDALVKCHFLCRTAALMAIGCGVWISVFPLLLRSR